MEFRVAALHLQQVLVAALLEWFLLTANRQDHEKISGMWNALDPDSTSLINRWCVAAMHKDLDALHRLAASPEALDQPPVRIAWFGWMRSTT